MVICHIEEIGTFLELTPGHFVSCHSILEVIAATARISAIGPIYHWEELTLLRPRLVLSMHGHWSSEFVSSHVERGRGVDGT
jgi:hypothetical protein